MAGGLFDAQYLARKTPQYAVKQGGADGKEVTIEYKNLHPDQYFAMRGAAKDKPNAKFGTDGSVKVKVGSADELAKCNKYAARYLCEDKSIDFVKSQGKDFNDDLRASQGRVKYADIGLTR
jgi:hypothetical protein